MMVTSTAFANLSPSGGVSLNNCKKKDEKKLINCDIIY